jgi:hypothetical protein
VIQQKIENQLSDAVLSGKFKAGDTVIVDADFEDTEEIEEGQVVLRKGDQDFSDNNHEFEEEPVAMG